MAAYNPVITSAMATPTLDGAPSTGPVIANRASGIYHLPGQRHYRDVAERNRVYFDSEAAARAAGFEPARR